jgi:hypothetical protein
MDELKKFVFNKEIQKANQYDFFTDKKIHRSLWN